MDGYRYLFPYEKVPVNSHILIYGAGFLGQEYLKQLLITNYCTVVGFVDKNYANYPNMCIPVYSPNQIGSLKFDMVVIALRGEIALPSVKNILRAQGIVDEQIVYVLERTNINPTILGTDNEEDNGNIYAYERSLPSFAVLLAGGFGDLVIQKRLLIELIRLVPSVQIDLYTVQNADFLKWLYSDFGNINNIILDLGIRYSSSKEKYSLSFQIIGSGFIEINYFEEDDFGIHYAEFVHKINMLKSKCEEEKLSVVIPSAVMFMRRIYNGENCYTGFNYGNIFSINDKHVNIPFLPEDEKDYIKLNLSNYITINVGNGSNSNEKQIAKAWPFARFQRTVTVFKKKYPDISVVQIGAKDEQCLENADCAIMGRPFGLIAYILKNAIFHLDIEGGLVHLASQIGTKCIVLFGPTSIDYNAYDNNINIKVGTCSDCYGYYLDNNRCARHMENPDCMYNITPEIVLEHIDSYMKERNTQ